MELEFSNNNQQAGFRLKYSEVRNWGTFHDKIWGISPDGSNSLMTGDIGSGKSTFADAITCLLFRHDRINFNKAAGAENKERTLKTYIKGEYKKQRNETTRTAREIYLRPDNTKPTILLGCFSNAGLGEEITLAQVLWIEDDGKTGKILLITNRAITIAEDLSGFGSIAELRKRLKLQPGFKVFDDNFADYSREFRQAFGMKSDRAVDLFYQTVSMKSVSSLTDFVRDHMLDKPNVKEQIDELKRRFENLNKAHEAVVSARKQKEILEPMIVLARDYNQLLREIKEQENIRDTIPYYFALQKIELLDKAISEEEHLLLVCSNKLDNITIKIDELRGKQSQLQLDIFNNGGKRLGEIEAEIKRREISKGQKEIRANAYLALAKKVNLPQAKTEQSFYSNLRKIEELQNANEEKTKSIEVRRDPLVIEERELINKIEEEKKELASLNNRETQIPNELMFIREQIIHDLELDVEEIPFMGELLKVSKDEAEWEGVIERLLGGFGRSILVPEHLYKRVSSYINDKRIKDGLGRGQRLDYYEAVTDLSFRDNTDLHDDSVLNKIQIKEGNQYAIWLEQELKQRFNLRCVDITSYQKMRDVITKEGQIKIGKKRNSKDDRKDLWNRKGFVLGWSNIEKKKVIQQEIDDLTAKHDSVSRSLFSLKEETNQVNNLRDSFLLLSQYKNFSELNWQDEVDQVQKLIDEKVSIEKSSNALKELQALFGAVSEEIKNADDEKVDLAGQKANHTNAIGTYKQDKSECQKLLINPIDEFETYFPILAEILKEQSFSIRSIDKKQADFKETITGKGGTIQKLNQQKESKQTEIVNCMNVYRRDFPVESIEFSLNVDGFPEYLKRYEAIINDELPKHEHRLKDELKSKAIEGIASLHNKLEGYGKDIKQKIKEINKHLRGVNYNPGTYIELEAELTQDKQIAQFNEDLKACYVYGIGEEELYTEDKFNQVKNLLDKFSGAKPGDLDWTKKVTDVTQWYEFNAMERNEDGSDKEFYPGSSGKSGGQKEKLAYTVLASALAFQFGLEASNVKSRSFRFVMIDEAFGRGSDDSTEYGLRLFEKLNLQLLVITPLQKVNVIERYVQSVHFIANPDENDSQIIPMTIKDYLERKSSLLNKEYAG